MFTCLIFKRFPCQKLLDTWTLDTPFPCPSNIAKYYWDKTDIYKLKVNKNLQCDLE